MFVTDQDFARCAKDPEYFIENFIKIGDEAIVLHLYKRRVIANFINYKMNIQSQPRSSGMTTLFAALCLWMAIFRQDKQIAITSPSHNGAKDILRVIREMHSSLPDHLRTPLVENNRFRITMANGSSIFGGCMNSAFMRGITVSLLYCDNFAGATPKCQAEFWLGVLPHLISSSVFITASSPHTDDIFTQLWISVCSMPNGMHPEKINEEERII